MKVHWRRFKPTPDQERQRQHFKRGLIAEVNLFGREGVEPAVIHSVLGEVQADLITTHFGAEEVAPALRALADYFEEELRGDNKQKESDNDDSST